jgi:hypothetical protein
MKNNQPEPKPAAESLVVLVLLPKAEGAASSSCSRYLQLQSGHPRLIIYVLSCEPLLKEFLWGCARLKHFCYTNYCTPQLMGKNPADSARSTSSRVKKLAKMGGLSLPDVVRVLLKDNSVLRWDVSDLHYEVINGPKFEARYRLAFGSSIFNLSLISIANSQVQFSAKSSKQDQGIWNRKAFQPHA